jgi:alpha-methylacyl-CoA racemase
LTAQPLSGIRILDLSRLLPGPYLTQLLADLGAEVIKVETPLAGDYTRMAPPEMGLGDLYGMINQGKKSLALNYRNARGRELFLQLAATADVILEGFRPTIADKYGIGYQAVRAFRLWPGRPLPATRRA